MKKTLLILTIIVGIIIVVYGASLILDYMVTYKYHVQGGLQEEIIYTTKERSREITSLTRYFYFSIGFALLAIISSLIAIFSKSKS